MMRSKTIIVSILVLVSMVSVVRNIMAQPVCFGAVNAKLAEEYQKVFQTFTNSTTCEPGEVACINDAFAKCVTKNVWSIQQCSEGLKCAVLPLVNKQGVSVTCDTEADRIRRINDAKKSCPEGSHTIRAHLVKLM